MLNPKTNVRELAYIVEVSDTKELENYNNVHYVHINGWWCVAAKELKSGDKAIYFEIDSILPKTDARFSFMEKKKYRVKTQKMCGVVSQGLVLSLKSFPELSKLPVGTFVTDRLGVELYDPRTYISKEEKTNPSVNGWSKSVSRHPFLKSSIVTYLMRFTLVRYLLSLLFIKKKDYYTWPQWLPKTGSERVQNIPNILADKDTHWVITEKVDGMSTSMWLDSDNIYSVASHNVVLYKDTGKDSREQSSGIVKGQSYVKNNIWLDMSDKYSIKDILLSLKKEYKLKTVAIQGESYGDGVQKRVYGKSHKEQDFVVFHIWFDGKRIPIKDMEEICEKYYLKSVYVFSYDYILPDTVEELVKDIDSRKSHIDGGMIEGFVIYSQDGSRNYKCVSPSYLVKYHG